MAISSTDQAVLQTPPQSENTISLAPLIDKRDYGTYSSIGISLCEVWQRVMPFWILFDSHNKTAYDCICTIGWHGVLTYHCNLIIVDWAYHMSIMSCVNTYMHLFDTMVYTLYYMFQTCCNCILDNEVMTCYSVIPTRICINLTPLNNKNNCVLACELVFVFKILSKKVISTTHTILTCPWRPAYTTVWHVCVHALVCSRVCVGVM
jgi:hypothetical protein